MPKPGTIVIACLAGMLANAHWNGPAKGPASSAATLECQGEYSQLNHTPQGEVKRTVLDHWQMSSLADGTYSVSTEQARLAGTGSSEHRILSPNMLPIAFAMELPGHKDHPGTQIKISCKFESTRIACVLDDYPKYPSVQFSLAQTPPYVFMPIPDASPLDFAWFLQMELWQTERSVGRTTSLPLISFRDNLKGEDLQLAVIETEHVKYLGQENVEVVNQKILAHKFQDVPEHPGDPEGPTTYWMSSSGLLLQAAGNSGASLVLSDYHGPPLGNE
jgi:hypothetical protein